jgi:hypothetical protein
VSRDGDGDGDGKTRRQGKRHSKPSLFATASTCADGIVALTFATHSGCDDRFCRAVESAGRL